MADDGFVPDDGFVADDGFVPETAAKPAVTPLAKAFEPITSYPATYSEMNKEAREQVGHGIGQLSHPESAWDVAKGAGNVALGTVNYVGSPLNAALRTVVGKPLEEIVGVPKEYSEFAAGLAIPGVGLTRVAKTASAVPSSKKLYDAATAAYNAPEVAALKMHPQAMTFFGEETAAALKIQGYDPLLAPKTFGLLEKATVVPEGSQFVTANNVQTIRRMLGKAAESPDKTERAAAQISQHKLDDFMANIPQNAVLEGDAAAASKTLQDARGNYAAASRSDRFQNALELAEKQAARAGVGGNWENATRQRITSILNSPAKSRGLSSAEKSALEDYVQGTFTRNSLRVATKVMGGDNPLMAAIHAGFAYSTYGASLAAPLTGFALKKINNAISAKELTKIDELLRSRSPLAKETEKAISNWTQAGGALTNQPTTQNATRFFAASQLLGDKFKTVGVNADIQKLMEPFQGPGTVPAAAQPEQNKRYATGGSVFDKMHMARKRAGGGGTDVPFNEWDAVPRNAEGIPQIRIEKPPVNEADEAQAAREAAAARVAGKVRGAPYEPTPPSTEGKTWMMEPGKEAVQSGNYENTLPPNVRLNDAGIPYNVETGEELKMVRRPSVLPLTRTPDGVQWAVPKIVELAGDIVNPLAVTKGLRLKPGEFALGSGPIKRAVLEQPNAPTFYSALDRAVADIPQTKASAEQWAATLANRPGVKPEEIQWRGLDQYLAGRQGQTVTKQEIADHLAGNKVELGSVVKGKFNSADLDKAAVKARETGDWVEYDRLLNQAKSNETNNTKYHSYQLPGGENYSENLLTLPNQWEAPRAAQVANEAKIKALRQEMHGTSGTNEIRAEIRSLQDANAALQKQISASPIYKSPHWDEPNPVTHMRTNERTIGNTSSHHIEEVQSDWHQKGRTEGYADPAKRDIAARELLTAESELKKQSAGQINRNYKEAIDNQVEFYANPERDVEFAEQWFGETPEQQSAALRYMAAKREFSALGGVPDAPFKKTWPDLTMKQALRDAVENGKDRLSWTPGEAQAKRYDLSQHVKEIEYIKNSDGTYRVGIADKDGEPIRSLPGIDVNRMTMAQIEATVGKEVAVKIENRAGRRYRGHDGHTLEGLDLKVGGEGMNEFYDKMLPKAVEKLGKAYGVKVQRGVDTTGNPVNYVDIPPAWKQEILKKGFPLFASGGSVFDKMHAAKHMAGGGGLESFIKSLGSQGAAFGTQTEQEQAGHQRDPISELGKGAYNAVEHLAKENIDNANLLATGNRDQFSGKPGFEAGMLTMGATPFGMTKGGVNIGHGPGFPLSFTERMEQGKQVAMNAYNRGAGGGSYGFSAKGRTAPDAPKGSHDRFIQENKSRWEQDKKAALDAYRQTVNPQESQHLLAPGESYADFLNSFKKGGSVFDKMKRASK